MYFGWAGLYTSFTNRFTTFHANANANANYNTNDSIKQSFVNIIWFNLV